MKKILIIALLSALVFFASLFMILTKVSNSADQKQNEYSKDVQKIKVVKAIVDIPPYTKITEEMVEITDILAEQTFKDFFKKTEDVVGRITVSDIYQGDVISTNRIAKEGDVALGLAYNVQEGMRAMTVSVNIEQGVANTLKVGNYVDVIFTGNFMDEEEDANGQKIPAGIALDSILGEESPANSQVIHNRVNSKFSIMAFQKLKVLALDDKFFTAKDDTVTENSYACVTVEVTPEQAIQFAMLKRTCNADLVLRNQNDEEVINEPRGEVLVPYETNPEEFEVIMP